MSALDRKMLRDLRRLWAQGLAVALVLACGVATLVLARGAYLSLDETRAAYYERYRFAHVFAGVTRAPEHVAERIAAIEGVAAVEPRVAKPVLLDIPDLAEPASGVAISLRDHGEPAANRVHLRSGRLPEPGRTDEVAVNAGFAEANGFAQGSTFSAIMNGVKRRLTITGTVLSPEFVYATGPGSLVPDDRRFAVIFMSRQTLGAVFDLDGAFNDIAILLRPDASEALVIDAVDIILAPYGGTGAYGRDTQFSNAFLEGELTQLFAMSAVIPPIFLFVSAYLINMILSRLTALEREQIGLMKALGYGGPAIAGHYLKLVLIIALIGVVIGYGAGTWLGIGMTRLYGKFYSFPFLIFQWSLATYLVAGSVAVASSLLGAARSVHVALQLAPAVAMRAPAPPAYRRLKLEALGIARLFSGLTTMALRYLMRWPLRAALTTLGLSFSVALLVVALFTNDSVDYMIDTLFFRSSRQDATLDFGSARSPRAADAALRLPGVMRAEPYRDVAVVMRNGHLQKRLSISGQLPQADLTRVLDLDEKPVDLPSEGLVISERVASQLALARGSRVEVEFLEGRRRRVVVPVSAVIRSYLGLGVYMDLDALNKLTGEGPRISGVQLSVDSTRIPELYAAVKEVPALSGIALQDLSLVQFRETVEQNILYSTVVYITLSVIIAFGVVYNSARIELSERARELAGLRVLGFTRWEVSRVLLIELGVVVVLAQPLGWLLGYAFAFAVIAGFESDIFRVPFVIERSTFGLASLVVIAAAIVSGLAVRRRIDRLDLISVLKTRD